MSNVFQRRPKGFALVLALALMSLMLLLMVSLATFFQLEVHSATQERNMAAARANALLGMSLALSELQAFAGPDQRATARADILDEEAAEPYWTGVWHTQPQADASDPFDQGNPRWLVSTSDPSALDPVTGIPLAVDSVGLVSGTPSSSAPRVSVERVPVPTHLNTLSGHYAYWVSDEGLKAAVNLTRPVGLDPQTSEYRRILATAAKNAPGLIPELDFFDETTNSTLTRLIQIEHAAIAETADNPSFRKEQIHEHIFNITHLSQGLLTNAKAGGLKFDLTTELARETDFLLTGYIYDFGPPWDLMRDYYRNFRITPGETGMQVHSREAQMRTPRRNLGDWAQKHGLFPVLVAAEIVLGIGAREIEVDVDRAFLTVQPMVVLANPYNVAMEEETYVFRWRTTNPQNQVDPSISITFVNITGGERSVVQLRDGGQSVPGVEYDALHLNRFIPNYETDSGQHLSPQISINDLRFRVTTRLEPGEIMVFSLPDGLIPYQTDPHDSDLSTVLELQPGLSLGRAELMTDDPDMLEQLTLRDDEVAAYISAPGDYNQLMFVSGTDEHGNLRNNMRPDTDFGYGSVGEAGFGSNLSPFEYSRMRTYYLPGTGRQVTLGPMPQESLRMELWLKGSAWTTSGSLRTQRHAMVKPMENYNIRAPYHATLSTGDFFRASPLYAGEFRNVASTPQIDLLALWERDAWTGPLPPSPANPEYTLILFHVPREPLQSLGELQHLNFAKDSHTPTYQVGHSFPNPFLPPHSVESTTTDPHYVDMPWLLNTALWDNYFFSTLEQNSDGSYFLRNPRLQAIQPLDSIDPHTISDPQRIAEFLWIDGQFNVNSTSVEAWKAVLMGNSGMDVPYDDIADNQSGLLSISENEQAPILRNTHPSGPEYIDGESDEHVFWRGFRKLTHDEADRLAKAIVEEIRMRGPFLSLADFVNRKLTADSSELPLAARGAIQAAIEKVAINPPGESDQVLSGALPPSAYTGGFPESVVSSEHGISGSRIAVGPGAITQGDILSKIGSYINVRSDSFIIRAYGDAIDPLRSPEAVIARAWCEAIVQRRYEYVDTSNPANMEPEDSNFSNLNSKLGRRFEVISFRWLSEDEL